MSIDFIESKYLRTRGRQFFQAWAQKEDLKRAGIEIFLQLYGGKKNDSLKSLRLVMKNDLSEKFI